MLAYQASGGVVDEIGIMVAWEFMWTVTMFERMTEGSIRAIMFAQEEARRLGHNHVGTEQMLLGLLKLSPKPFFGGEAFAANCFRDLGLKHKDVRAVVDKCIGRGDGRVEVEIPFTAGAKSAFRQADEECKQMAKAGYGAGYINSGHMLLGIVAVEDAVPSLVFQHFKISSDTVRQSVLFHLKSS